MIMSKKTKFVPEVIPLKSGKGKKFVKFVVVAGAIAAGAHLVTKIIKENKELLRSIITNIYWFLVIFNILYVKLS